MSLQPEQPADDADGLAGLRGRRERRKRVAPAPRVVPASRHPRSSTEPGEVASSSGTATLDEPLLTPAAPPAAVVDEIPREISRETARAEAPAVPVAQPERSSAAARPAPARSTAAVVASPAAGAAPAPTLEVDLDDRAALIPSPTVLNVPGSVMRRFEAARAGAASHTGLVLDALRAHVAELPELVLAARPGPREGDLFPWRPSPESSRTTDRPEPLRVRPTVGELKVIDGLVDWVAGELARRRPGGRKVSRSEVVTAALRAYLPEIPAGRRR